MTELLTWLAGGASRGPSDARLVFDWALTPTGWAIAVLACALVAWLSYLRLSAPAWARWTGITLRACALALIVLLACGPRLVQTTERVEKDWVVVLADRSASMAVRDGNASTAATSTAQPDPISRHEQLTGLLARTSPAWATLASQRQVVWLGFDSGTYPLAAASTPEGTSTTEVTGTIAGPIPPELTPAATGTAPTGTRSDLAGALAQALAVSTARPLSGVVVLSDGQSTSAIPPWLVRELQSRAVGVYPVPLGADGPVGDVALIEATAPSAAFVGDSVPVSVKLRRTGSLEDPVRVELIDSATGRVLDTQTASFGPGTPTPTTPTDRAPATAQLTLVGSPPSSPQPRDANAPREASGQLTWTVRVVPVPRELLTDNNQRDLTLRTVQRPLRLMYVDGYPRWEYRFLKNVLARERSVRFNATLLSPGRRYIAEGAEEVFTLPTTPAGWEQYDVIMLGDVQPGVFTPEQMAQLRQRVTVGGAGLVWIAGAGAVPSAMAGTPLADLLPVFTGAGAGSGPGSGQRFTTWSSDVTLRPTPLAERLGVLRLADRQSDGSFWPAEVSDPASGWSRLRWAQRLEPASLKPATEALAMAEPVEAPEGQTASSAALPLVVTMRYGAGRVVYVGTDELWRFRYGRGEELVERFYLQLIRLLGRESVARAGRQMTLELSPARAEVGTAVRVSVELLDQSLVEAAPASVTVRIEPHSTNQPQDQTSKPVGVTPGTPARPEGPTGAAIPQEIKLRPEVALPSSITPSYAPGTSASRRTYVGTWVPRTPGAYVARVTAPLITGAANGPEPAQAISAPAEVVPPDDELATPQTDHPLLASLAQQTGGSVLTEAKIGRLTDLLPRREVRVVIPTTQATLWDRPTWLVLLTGLLVAEWVLRRLVRLS